MKVKIEEKTYKLEWKYDRRSNPDQVSLLLKSSNGSPIREVSICKEGGSSVSEARYFAFRKLVNEMYPKVQPTAKLKNSSGRFVCMDYTQEELELKNKRKEMRRLWWNMFLTRKPRITKSKVRKALSFLTPRELQKVLDVLNVSGKLIVNQETVA